jgi:lysozyme
MAASAQLYEYLRWWEGKGGRPVLAAYRDTNGTWTIGYGSTQNVTPDLVIDHQEAERRLSAAVGLVVDGVNFSLGAYPLSQQQFDALVSLAYNIGMSAFRTSSPCLLVKMGKYDRVGPAMELWNKERKNGVLVVNAGLVNRRAADRGIWERGEYVRP